MSLAWWQVLRSEHGHVRPWASSPGGCAHKDLKASGPPVTFQQKRRPAYILAVLISDQSFTREEYEVTEILFDLFKFLI